MSTSTTAKILSSSRRVDSNHSNGVPHSTWDGASVHCSYDGSFNPSVDSDLLDGYLCDDELNEIPELPAIGENPGDGINFHSSSNVATNIALTASAIDGAIGDMPFLDPRQPASSTTSAEHTGEETDSKVLSSVIFSGIETLPDKASSSIIKAHTIKRELPKLSGSAEDPKKRRVLESNNTPTVTTSVVSPVSPVYSSLNGPELPSTPIISSDSSVEQKQPDGLSGWCTDCSASVDLQAEANIETEYIKMLISENGPAEVAKGIVSKFATDGRTRQNRQNLSQEDRVKASRDRNREHARNTRKRKKVYVDELRRTLAALLAERESNKDDQENRSHMEAQQREVRYGVLREFLNLRGSNVRDVQRWDLILVPDFELILPSIQASGTACNNEHPEYKTVESTLTGVLETMRESQDFFSFMQSMGTATDGHVISLAYETNQSNFFVDGSTAVLEWNASTVGIKKMDIKDELKFHGNIKATFDPESNKLVSAKFAFDTGVLLREHRSLLA